MRYTFIFLLLLIISCKSTQVPPDKAAEKLGANPYFLIDGQPVEKKEIMKYQPTDIASVTTYYGKDATNNFGDKAIDGAVSISTNTFATNKYETLFKSFSKDYEKAMKENDRSEIQYILNDRILTENFEGDLASIDNKLLKDLKVIDQNTLIDKFKIIDKKIGVLITSKRPKNVYNSKKKF